MLLERLIIGLVSLSLLGSAPELVSALPVPQTSQETQPVTLPEAAQPAASPTQSSTPAPAQTPAITDRANSLPDAPSAAQDNQDRDASTQQPAQSATEPSQVPSGTAAARNGSAKGGAASKPAGAAIAPAKQHQRRSLLIKLGLIAGAGVAIGSVAALSKGSPSNPPGSH